MVPVNTLWATVLFERVAKTDGAGFAVPDVGGAVVAAWESPPPRKVNPVWCSGGESTQTQPGNNTHSLSSSRLCLEKINLDQETCFQNPSGNIPSYKKTKPWKGFTLDPLSNPSYSASWHSTRGGLKTRRPGGLQEIYLALTTLRRATRVGFWRWFFRIWRCQLNINTI